MHPHNNCSVCHGGQVVGPDALTKLDAHQQLDILLRCFRQSAQDTLGLLDKRGYEIVKKSE